MSDAIYFGCLWVLAAVAVALLLMRDRFRPRVLLVLTVPILVIWIVVAHDWLIGSASLAAFAALFRNPLGSHSCRLEGDAPEVSR